MPDIQLIQFDPTTGLAKLGMGRAPKILTGIDLLAQIVVLSYLRNPGRDVIDPSEGSGLRDAIGQYNLTSNDEIKILVVQRTKLVENEILGRQASSTGEPTERLKKLTVLDVASDLSSGQVLARVRLVSEAGDMTDILV